MLIYDSKNVNRKFDAQKANTATKNALDYADACYKTWYKKKLTNYNSSICIQKEKNKNVNRIITTKRETA